jgi:putative transposase
MLNRMAMPHPIPSSRQQEFVFRRRGGLRRGAGRKARPERVGLLPHSARAEHLEAQPVHVTARATSPSPNLRSQRIFTELQAIFSRASEKGFRLVHFSVQGNHLHMIVEADDGTALARGVQRVLSRVAMAVNAISRRSGRLWRDRHHRQTLTSPRQVRNALVYVLFNARKHELPGSSGWLTALASCDPCSSVFWFKDWSPAAPPPPMQSERVGPPPVVPARSWLANDGWRRRGLVRFDEWPRSY